MTQFSFFHFLSTCCATLIKWRFNGDWRKKYITSYLVAAKAAYLLFFLMWRQPDWTCHLYIPYIKYVHTRTSLYTVLYSHINVLECIQSLMHFLTVLKNMYWLILFQATSVNSQHINSKLPNLIPCLIKASKKLEQEL